MNKEFDDAMKTVLGRIRVNNTGGRCWEILLKAAHNFMARSVYFGTEVKQEQEEKPKTQKSGPMLLSRCLQQGINRSSYRPDCL